MGSTATLFSPSEQSYTHPIASSSSSSSSYSQTRADARAPLSYRTVGLSTSVYASSMGSARVTVGDTEVICSVNGSVESGPPSIGVILEFAPTLPPSSSSTLSQALHSHLTQTFNSPSLLSPLLILPPSSPTSIARWGGKSWHLTLTVLVTSHASGGSIWDLAFLGAGAALVDTLIPATRAVGQPSASALDDEGGAGEEVGIARMLKTGLRGEGDWELVPEQGERRLTVPVRTVGVTLYLIGGVAYLDPTPLEAATASSALHLLFASTPTSTGDCDELSGMTLLGGGEVPLASLSSLVKEGQKVARELKRVLDDRSSSSME